MSSFREMPKKSLPTVMLLDLRRRNIHVPTEIQMRIMYYKEIAETRDEKKKVMKELTDLPMCQLFQRPRTLGKAGHFTQFVVRLQPKQFLDTPCHHCNRMFNHKISLDMMAESIRREPNLDRFYNACADFAVQWYRDISKKPIGEKLCHVAARPMDMDTFSKIWNFSKHIFNMVRVIAVLEETVLANMAQHEQFQVVEDIMGDDMNLMGVPQDPQDINEE